MEMPRGPEVQIGQSCQDNQDGDKGWPDEGRTGP